VLAVLGSAQTASGAGPKPLTAPVVHEVFTLLPCPAKQVSTLDIEGCQEHEIVRFDRRIDALAKTIFARLRASDEITHQSDHSVPVDYARRAFSSGEAAWLVYRNAFCASEENVYEGGTAAGIVGASCTVSVDEQHVKDLTSFLRDLERH
jgi:uncharacterized protein YecT (DUF1311 family)